MTIGDVCWIVIGGTIIGKVYGGGCSYIVAGVALTKDIPENVLARRF